jgi:hypothetical protein
MTDTELIAHVRAAAEHTVRGAENPAKDLILAIATRLEAWNATARPAVHVTAGTGVDKAKKRTWYGTEKT